MNPNLAYSQDDKLRVFVASRTIFVGPNALIRKNKKVHELVLKHQQPLKQVINEYGTVTVVDIIKGLLEKRVYESETTAKTLLPELYRTTQGSEIKLAKSENSKAKSEAKASGNVASGKDDNEDQDSVGRSVVLNDGLRGSRDTLVATASPTSAGLPTLFPCYLPYRVQHMLLTNVQRLLEETSFDFATKWMPLLLEETKWDCAEAVELTTWTKLFEERWQNLPIEAVDANIGVSFSTVLFSAHELRDAAVHRRPITGMGIDRLILNAGKFAKALRDEPKAAQLHDLHLQLQKRLRDMDLNKDFLEHRFEEELRMIAEERAALDRKEKNALTKLRQEDREHGLLIGSILEASVRNICNRDSVLAFEEKKDSDDAQAGISPTTAHNDSDGGGVVLLQDDK